MKRLLQTAMCFAIGMIPLSIQAQDKHRTSEKLSDSDQVAITIQKICPVMGAELGSMGKPVKVKIGKQVAFLCCKSCVGKQVKANHWKTIQDRIAKAQATCPIMGKPVDSSMKSMVVQGQRIFVCCPPCIDKIKDDTKSALAKIHTNRAKFIQVEKRKISDAIHVQAQSICPVTGAKLGSMGQPVKVKVGKSEVAFLCCKSCVGKKIDAKHWAKVQANLAKAQGTCPVMGKPVDATMKSTIVKGRKIFVCCPPCIDKIQKDANAYVGKLNRQIKSNLKSHKK